MGFLDRLMKRNKELDHGDEPLDVGDAPEVVIIDKEGDEK